MVKSELPGNSRRRPRRACTVRCWRRLLGNDTTLETTSGQMAPPTSGHPLECYLNQVAFPESWLFFLALGPTPGWYQSLRRRGACPPHTSHARLLSLMVKSELRGKSRRRPLLCRGLLLLLLHMIRRLFVS